MKKMFCLIVFLATAASLTSAPPVAPMPKAVSSSDKSVPAPVVPPVIPPPGVSAEPLLTGPTSVKYMVELKARNVPAASALRWQVFAKNKDGDYVLAVGKIQSRTVLVEKAFFFAGDVGDYLVQCSFQKGMEYIDLEWRGRITGGVIPPPVPPGPGPVPPKPPGPVDPLKSFRIIFIYESGMNLTADQRAVVYGAAVETWMNANCTDGKNGWRRRDKDAPGEADPTMAELWKSVQPAVTVTPCVAMERNGKVEIVNLEATAAKMIEKFTTYRGK